MLTATRYHDFSAGHRVVGHDGKCQHLHGHNYRVWFTVEGPLRRDVVMDFGAIKAMLCAWLEAEWDHKFLIWTNDPWGTRLVVLDPHGLAFVPFNPTAENMAEHLVKVVGPQVLKGTGITLVECRVEETRKCSATCSIYRE